MTQPLIRMIYASQAVRDPNGNPPDLDPILAAARRKNPSRGVTGALLVSRGEFGQVLEGPEDGVEEVFGWIEGDPRHEDVDVLDIRTISARAFPDWAMGHVGRAALGGDRRWENAAQFGAGASDPMVAALFRRVLGGDAALIGG